MIISDTILEFEIQINFKNYIIKGGLCYLQLILTNFAILLTKMWDLEHIIDKA